MLIFYILLLIIVITILILCFMLLFKDKSKKESARTMNPSGFFLDTYYSLSEPSIYPSLTNQIQHFSSILRIGYIIVGDKIYSDQIPKDMFQNVSKGWYFLCYPSPSKRIIAYTNNEPVYMTTNGLLLFLGNDPKYTLNDDGILTKNIEIILQPKWDTNEDVYVNMLYFQKAFNYKVHLEDGPKSVMMQQNKSFEKMSQKPFVIASSFSTCPCFTTSHKTLLDDHAEDAANFIVSALDVLINDFKLQIDACEPYNEPDGNWGTQFTPQQFGACIKKMHELKTKQIQQVMLLGPGLSQVMSQPGNDLQAFLQYIDPDSLDGYSFHLWDNAYTFQSDTTFNTSIAINAIHLFQKHGGMNKKIFCTEFGKQSPNIVNFWYQSIQLSNYPNTDIDLWNFYFQPGDSTSYPNFQSYSEYPDAQDISPESVSLIFGTWISLLSLPLLSGIVYWQLMDNGFAYWDSDAQNWINIGTNQGFGIFDRVMENSIKNKNMFLDQSLVTKPHGLKPLGTWIKLMNDLLPDSFLITDIPTISSFPIILLGNENTRLASGANHFRNITPMTVSFPINGYWDQIHVYMIYPEGTDDPKMANQTNKNMFYNYSGYRKNGQIHGSIITVMFAKDVRNYKYNWYDPYLQKEIILFEIEQKNDVCFLTLLPGCLFHFRTISQSPVLNNNVVYKKTYCETFENLILDSCTCAGIEKTCNFWQQTNLDKLNKDTCICKSEVKNK